ncbi:MAG: hypothetical protein PHQ65_05850 [Bacteroidales bacterium]|nr:hypothetical protein [Bacteroidales bacterium]
MKKPILLLFALFLLGTTFAEQLSWRFANPRIIRISNAQHLQFDVQVKADLPGTYLWAGTIKFNFNTATFNNAAGSWSVLTQGAFSGLNTAGGLKYTVTKTITSITGGKAFNIALTGDLNAAWNGPNGDDFAEIPDDWTTIVQVSARLLDVSGNAIAGIDFYEAGMNGPTSQQYQTGFEPGEVGYYQNPSLFDSRDFLSAYTGRFYSTTHGWSQIGGLTNNVQYTNWGTAVSTTIWEGNAAIEQADNTAAMFNNLNILNGATLDIAANKYATVNGDLTNTGLAVNLTVANSGSLITNGTVTGEGTISTAVAANEWHLISMPIPGQTANNFMGEYLQSYAEATNTWSYITDETTPLTVGKGYATWASDKSYAGVFNTGDYPVAGLTFGGALHGFNLVGNPYPSGLDISSVNTWGSNITANTWVWDQSISNYQTNLPLIGAGQGFFVQASGAPSFQIPNTGRAHSATGILKSEVVNQLRIHIEGNNCADYTYIRFDQGSTSSYDFDYDTPKMFGAADAPQLYTQIVSDNFANLTRNVLPQIDGNDVVKMNLKVGAAGTYTITASDLESFTDDVTATLVDLQAGISQKLNDNAVYTFTAEPTDNEARFLIQFKSATGDVENDTYGIRIYAFNNQAYVDMPANVNGIVTVTTW